MSEAFNLESLYVPWHNHQQTVHQISKGVWYLGYFGVAGEVWAKHKVWSWKRNNVSPNLWGRQLVASQEFVERSIDASLNKLDNCVVLSTTPTYYSQFQGACLLKQRGFELLENSCYKHPNYNTKSDYNPEHPGCPDRYLHWEHIWWKVLGKPTEIGCPLNPDQLNNCGVDSGTGLNYIDAHNTGERRQYLAVAWLPRGTPFPPGWKRFFSAQDYKLGVNFDFVANKGSVVQKCDHNFDLKVFEGWEPNFEKWRPA